MKEKSNLPVVINSNLPAKLKNVTKKTAKILGYSAATIGIAGVGVAFPILLIPAIIGGACTSQKLLNETLYRSFKDLAFITRKHGNNMKIYQDVTRFDILNELKGLTDIEKAGFLQLQAILGLTRMPQFDRKGNKLTFETDSHGIIKKVFSTMQRLGYIENYEEKFLKKKSLMLPKLAFGNTKGLNEKLDIYNLRFQRTDKPIDLENPKLRRLFPAIFSSKKGLLAKKNYKIITNPDGTIEIDYKTKQEKDNKSSNENGRKDFLEQLKYTEIDTKEKNESDDRVHKEEQKENENENEEER